MAVIPWLSTDCIKTALGMNSRQWKISAHLWNERLLLIKIYLDAVANAAFKVVVTVAFTLLLWEFKSARH